MKITKILIISELTILENYFIKCIQLENINNSTIGTKRLLFEGGQKYNKLPKQIN